MTDQHWLGPTHGERCSSRRVAEELAFTGQRQTARTSWVCARSGSGLLLETETVDGTAWMVAAGLRGLEGVSKL